MKLASWSLAALLLVGSLITARAESEWLTGADGYTTALTALKDDKKPVAVYFYTDWCGYCRKLDSALNEGYIQLDQFVKVRINPEKGAQEQALARQYKVRGYPAFFVIQPDTQKPTQIRTYGKWDQEESESFMLDCRTAGGV